MSSIGWFEMPCPEIIKYCKENSQDKILLKEIRKIKFIKWYKEYLEFVEVEEQISKGTKNIEEKVKKYFKFLDRLLNNKKINQKQFDKVFEKLQNEISVYKGRNKIGSLISEKLQKSLGFKTLTPKIEIKKSNLHILPIKKGLKIKVSKKIRKIKRE